ncbi:MAG TPA: nuclear transport factor 2 family protein [Luteimonas sp.]|nr:nuclear transport factor 2 family protein [Luteimonas sp.]
MTTLLIGAALSGTAAAATVTADDPAAALLHAEAAACKAFQEGDAETLRKALTADFTLVDSRGNVTGLEQNLAEVAAREPYYDEFRNDGQRVRLYGDDTALIVGITHIRGKAGGEAFAADFRYTDTWVRRDGRWLLAASHASRLADAAP